MWIAKNKEMWERDVLDGRSDALLNSCVAAFQDIEANIVRKVYKHWLSRRKKTKKPLVRRLQIEWEDEEHRIKKILKKPSRV